MVKKGKAAEAVVEADAKLWSPADEEEDEDADEDLHLHDSEEEALPSGKVARMPEQPREVGWGGVAEEDLSSLSSPSPVVPPP